MDRFWTKVIKTGDCWLWTGMKDSEGYGRFKWNATRKNTIKMAAHRVAYILTFGDFDRALLCCHMCDNPACVNPAHLFLGTADDNAKDMIAKGRSLFGTKNPNYRHGRKVKIKY